MLSFTLFTDEQCDEILALAVSPQRHIREKICRTRMALAAVDAAIDDLMQTALNRGAVHFGFGPRALLHQKVDEWMRPRVTFYAVGESYGWHMDVPMRPPREMWVGASVQLRRSDEYTGGDLMVKDEKGRVHVASRGRGDVTIFDARFQHQVTPVTDGERASFTWWGYAGTRPKVTQRATPARPVWR